MILYTVMPLELVFQNTQGEVDRFVEMTYLGRQIISRVDASGSRQVARLLSTDPYDFLDPRFSPGANLYV